MAKVYDTAKEKERVILVAVDLSENSDSTTVDISLDELEELAETAGAVTVGRVVQKRDAFHPGTYIGKGKMEELRDLVWQQQADTIVCDDELSPAQITNLEPGAGCESDRQDCYDIGYFCRPCQASEGKLQVELAQLRYRSSRLMGLGTAMSRLGGGIGTRGPGEEKTGDGPAAYQRPHSLAEQAVERSGAKSGYHAQAAKQESYPYGGYCRLYQCRKVNALKCLD